MKALLLLSAAAGVLLNSATLPAAREPAPLDRELSGCGPACAEVQAVAGRNIPRLVYEPDTVPSQLVYEPETVQPPEAKLAAPPAREERSAIRADPAPAALAQEQMPQSGGVRVVVSLPQQKAYVFDDGELVATSPVSTGKKGHETRAGTFRILQKKVHHRSNRYSNAPMPYMQRLTWQGVALHAGSLPGYPASHGCIRLPRSFAKKLYKLTDYSTSVTVTRQRPKSPEDALTLS